MQFAYRANAFSLRGRTAPTIRDELSACQDGTAIVEESDRAWKGSDFFEAMLSDRYQRQTAQAALKQKVGENYETRNSLFFGATALHRRISFGDPALDGRSIFIHFRANHGRKYDQLSENDPLVAQGRELVKDLVFTPPDVEPLPGVAGRIFDTHKLLLGTAKLCGDEVFIGLMTERLQHESVQLKEAQSIEPAGMVLQALIESLSTGSGELRFRYVRIRELRASIWNNHHVEMQPHQVAVMARNLGFETKHSHGVTVLVPTPGALLWACESMSYEDEAITRLRKEVLGDEASKKEAASSSEREPGSDG